jgi:hypothetical protein
MNVTIQQMERLLRGHHVFKQISFSMLLTRLKNDYAASPTQVKLEYCVNEINTFIDKYKMIMAADLAIIEKV